MNGLNGRERALLVLRNFKAGKHQDALLGYGMDDYDRREYNRLIGLIRACNTELASCIMVLHQQLRTYEADLRQLFVMEMWGEQSDIAQLYLGGYTKEPIIRSPYRALVEANEAPVKPEWGSDFEVLTDREASRVERLNATRNQVTESFLWRPFPAAEGIIESDPEPIALPWRLAEIQRVRVRRLFDSIWEEALATDAALAKVAGEFGGEDVLKPVTCGDLDHVIGALRRSHEFVVECCREFELTETPNDQTVRQVMEFDEYFASQG
jgi:hypothetical protein